MGIDWDRMVLGPTVGVFGETIWYTPAGGQPVDVQLVYDEGNRDINLAGGSTINSSNPIVSGQVSVFTDKSLYPVQGETIRIESTGDLFQIGDVNEDGKGALVLSLNYIGEGV